MRPAAVRRFGPAGRSGPAALGDPAGAGVGVEHGDLDANASLWRPKRWPAWGRNSWPGPWALRPSRSRTSAGWKPGRPACPSQPRRPAVSVSGGQREFWTTILHRVAVAADRIRRRARRRAIGGRGASGRVALAAGRRGACGAGQLAAGGIVAGSHRVPGRAEGRGLRVHVVNSDPRPDRWRRDVESWPDRPAAGEPCEWLHATAAVEPDELPAEGRVCLASRAAPAVSGGVGVGIVGPSGAGAGHPAGEAADVGRHPPHAGFRRRRCVPGGRVRGIIWPSNRSAARGRRKRPACGSRPSSSRSSRKRATRFAPSATSCGPSATGSVPTWPTAGR